MLLIACDTVVIETPAKRATSLIVAFINVHPYITLQKNIEKIKGVFEDVILEGGKEIWCGAVILSYLLKLIQHYSLIEYFSFLHQYE